VSFSCPLLAPTPRFRRLHAASVASPSTGIGRSKLVWNPPYRSPARVSPADPRFTDKGAIGGTGQAVAEELEKAGKETKQ